jgi:hypothetical protein
VVPFDLVGNVKELAGLRECRFTVIVLLIMLQRDAQPQKRRCVMRIEL